MRRTIKYCIAVLYIAAGLLLVIAGWESLSSFQRYGLGTLIIAYGVFRVYRVYNDYPADNQPDEENTEE